MKTKATISIPFRFQTRKEYRFSRGATFSEEELNTDLRIEKINASNIKAIQGRIVPAFSWESDDAFLKNGFGYVAMDGEKFAAIAFSAAVSSEEVDIGVETNEAYRNRGLAKIVARYMIREVLNIGKYRYGHMRPVIRLP